MRQAASYVGSVMWHINGPGRQERSPVVDFLPGYDTITYAEIF